MEVKGRQQCHSTESSSKASDSNFQMDCTSVAEIHLPLLKTTENQSIFRQELCFVFFEKKMGNESPPHPSLFSPHRLTIKPTDVRNKRSCFPPPIYSNTLHPFENGNTVVVIYFMGSPPTDVGVIAPHSFLE
ncbi:Hypothetical predicted protein [Podarcis lilfordi]|uniref:Uncharacterized protein n=1 Tax=Podarcis lilfordi TaxID=74358 RepID=A0AA35KMH6_9SAUR|nr:Hypothetical predicted protein [Podarcis lilfordi]